jgi:hypothetical protein
LKARRMLPDCILAILAILFYVSMLLIRKNKNCLRYNLAKEKKHNVKESLFQLRGILEFLVLSFVFKRINIL